MKNKTILISGKMNNMMIRTKIIYLVFLYFELTKCRMFLNLYLTQIDLHFIVFDFFKKHTKHNSGLR